MTIVLNGTTGITNDGGYTGDGISFADTTPANTLVTTTGGNVGIGTSSPATKLQVNGGSTTEVRLVSSGNLTSGAASLLRFGGSNSAISGYVGFGGNSSTYDLVNSLNGPMVFYTNDTERMRLDAAGNLLVGITSAVNSPANGICTTNPSGATSLNIGHGNGTPSGFGYMQYAYNGTTIGFISQNGTTAVAYNTTSDYRLKENVTPMVGALAKVQALKPVTYTWKSAPDEIGEGFIAHELAEVCPQAVTGEKDAVNEDGSIKPQSIDTSFLVATLTAAIQEQQAIITDLKSRIETLEAK
jgi:hypothetical protein